MVQVPDGDTPTEGLKVTFDGREIITFPNYFSRASIQNVGPGSRLGGVSKDVEVVTAGEMSDGEEMRALSVLPASATVRKGEAPERFSAGIVRLDPKIAVLTASAGDDARPAITQQVAD